MHGINSSSRPDRMKDVCYANRCLRFYNCRDMATWSPYAVSTLGIHFGHLTWRPHQMPWLRLCLFIHAACTLPTTSHGQLWSKETEHRSQLHWGSNEAPFVLLWVRKKLQSSCIAWIIPLCRTVEQNSSASIILDEKWSWYLYLFNTKVVMMIITIMIVIKMGMMTKLIAMIAMVVMIIW